MIGPEHSPSDRQRRIADSSGLVEPVLRDEDIGIVPLGLKRAIMFLAMHAAQRSKGMSLDTFAFLKIAKIFCSPGCAFAALCGRTYGMLSYFCIYLYYAYVGFGLDNF